MSPEEARDFIRRLEGKVSDVVSEHIDYLVAGKEPGSKLTHAERLGIPVMDENELRKLAEDGKQPEPDQVRT